MVFVRKKHHHFQAKVRVPLSHQEAHGGKEFLYLTLPTSDSRAAKAQADAWEAGLRLKWLSVPEVSPKSPSAELQPAQLRALYHDLRQRAEAGAFMVHTDGEDPVEAGIDYEIGKIADQQQAEDDEVSEADEFRLAALADARTAVQGLPVAPRRSLEASFRDLADDYMGTWRAKPGLKETNTEQQMLATFDLFGKFFGAKPIRDVREADAARFVDALRQLHPHWARKPEARGLTWANLIKGYGGQPKGLADATVNRHMSTLKTYWHWAKRRGYCSGENPFDGHHRTLKVGLNRHPYVAWSDKELEVLFGQPPERSDVLEVMIVGLYTGMRIDEIASLTAGDIHADGPVPYMSIGKAKTAAGVRDVPIHPALFWLSAKAKGQKADARLWDAFREEGKGKKTGGDVGKEFSRHKIGKGYTDRTKVFHSFRKNVVGQLEAANVPEHEVAQIVGHEKPGFTFRTYGASLPMARKAEIVALIGYSSLPVPAAYLPGRGTGSQEI